VALYEGVDVLVVHAVEGLAHAAILSPAMILRTVTWLSFTPRSARSALILYGDSPSAVRCAAVSSRHSSGRPTGVA
jgi:hypothetical protein